MDDSAAELPPSPAPPPSPDLARLRALHAATLAFKPQADPNATIQAAQTAQSLGDMFTAERLLKSAIRQDAQNAQAQQMLAELYRQEARYGEAKRLFLALHTRSPQSLDPYIGLAEVDFARGARAEAFTWLAQAGTGAAQTAENLTTLAHRYQDWDDFENASAMSAKALQIAPGDENAMLQRASILVQHGEMTESRQLLETLIVQHPQNGYAHRLLAVVLTNPNLPKQDYVRARSLLEKAVELTVTDAAIYRVAAIVYRQQHLYRLAAQSYDALLKLDPNSLEARYGLGQVYALLGKADWSREQFAIYTKLQEQQHRISLLNVALGVKPTDPARHTALARALEAQGDLSGALAQYQTAVLLSPPAGRNEARKAVAQCHARLGWPPAQEGAP